MFKLIFALSLICALASCTAGRYEAVHILWKFPQDSEIRVRGMWVRLPDHSILTSAHVVRDDSMIYDIDWERYQAVYRDIPWDRAIIARDTTHQNQPQIPKLATVQLWGPIYTEVSRSGVIVRIAGKVVDPAASVLGYDSLWRVVSLSGIVRIDVDLSPWDSGAPIYTSLWELVDVVHVR